MASWTVSFGYISRLHSSSLLHSGVALLPIAAAARSSTINSNTPRSPISNLHCCSTPNLRPAHDPNSNPLIVSPLLMLINPIWKTHSSKFELCHDDLPFSWHSTPSSPAVAFASYQFQIDWWSTYSPCLSSCWIRSTWCCSLCFAFCSMTQFLICSSSPFSAMSCSLQHLWSALIGFHDFLFLAF